MTEFEKLAEMIQDIDFAMMTTEGSDGSLYSRPMSTQEIDAKNFDGKLYFFARKDSPKMHEIEEHHRVNLAYSHPAKQKYVSVAGTAVITTDRQKMKELWKPAYKAWFPEGLEDAQLCLIEVTAQSAEYWNSPSSKLVQAFGFVKAAITGRPVKNAGQNEQINFHSSPGIH